MSQKYILHVCNSDKFLKDIATLILSKFPECYNEFYVYDDGRGFGRVDNKHINYGKSHGFKRLTRFLKLLVRINKADKIIAHSFNKFDIVLALFLCPWVLNRTYWLIWGADLYGYRDVRKSLKMAIKEKVRAKVIGGVGFLCTYLDGDYRRAIDWYSAKGKLISCLIYPSNLAPLPPKSIGFHDSTPKGNATSILLGNSATPSNHHIEIFEKLMNFSGFDFSVYTPLSYGDQRYSKHVIDTGNRILGKKFIPLLDFLPKAEYLNLLTGIDIVVFNHDRQQAMGNLISLLGLGKTVYLRKGTSQWKLFNELGIAVYDVDLFDFTTLPPDRANQNIKLVQEHFSRRKLLAGWSAILKENS